MTKKLEYHFVICCFLVSFTGTHYLFVRSSSLISTLISWLDLIVWGWLGGGRLSQSPVEKEICRCSPYWCLLEVCKGHRLLNASLIKAHMRLFPRHSGLFLLKSVFVELLLKHQGWVSASGLRRRFDLVAI